MQTPAIYTPHDYSSCGLLLLCVLAEIAKQKGGERAFHAVLSPLGHWPMAITSCDEAFCGQPSEHHAPLAVL